jgi:hypothetical protein
MSANRAAGGAAHRPQLDIDTLGLALLIAVSLAWLTGAPYLLVRAGVGLPFRLLLVDGVHCYIGLTMAVILVAKVRRAGLRRSVPAVPEVSLWDRWVSLSMAITYSAVLITGVVALLPLGDNIRTTIVNAHLLAAVWAAAPTTWHVITHRARLSAALSRVRWQFGIRALPRGLLLLVLAVPLLFVGAAVAPLTQDHAGLAWQSTGPQVFLDRLETAPDGRSMIAGGEGLYVSDNGRQWREVGNFGGGGSRTLVLALRVTQHAIYVGTSAGLYTASTADGPYRRLPSPASEVHGIEVAPRDPAVIWVAAHNGVWRSTDGGVHWSGESAGLAEPSSAWALRFFHGTIFLSELASVDRWDGSRWVRSSAQRYVNALDPSADGTALFASSMGQGLAMFDGRQWHTANVGMVEHAHGGVSGIHVDSVTDVGLGTIYAGTMLNGIAETRDGARTWSSVWPASMLRGDVWRVRPFGNTLIAATDFGLLTYGPIPAAPAAGVLWWLYLLAASLAGGVALVGLARPRRRTLQRLEVAPGAQAATMRHS